MIPEQYKGELCSPYKDRPSHRNKWDYNGIYQKKWIYSTPGQASGSMRSVRVSGNESVLEGCCRFGGIG